MSAITQRLFSLADEGYRQFQTPLLPSVAPECIIGVRTPVLRKLAKELAGTAEAEAFLRDLPHAYYEENNLHAFLIERETDFKTCINKLNNFLPYVNNWATCDGMKPKVLKTKPQELLEQIKIWLKSKNTYTVRYAINLLMSYYLDDDFSPGHLLLVANIKSEEYYINMMRAWFFATALAKQYDEAVKFIKTYILKPWVHNKTIQKALENCL